MYNCSFLHIHDLTSPLSSISLGFLCNSENTSVTELANQPLNEEISGCKMKD